MATKRLPMRKIRDALRLEASGLSRRQIASRRRCQPVRAPGEIAVRVSNVPDAEFEKAVDSDNPPTVTALAEQGCAVSSIPMGRSRS